AAAMSGPIRVVFIGGYGRSGSTLLDRMLSQCPGFLSTGELRHPWERSLTENQLCGCGEPFRECAVWQRVLQAAYGEGGVDVEAVLRLKAQVDRLRYVPWMGRAAPAGYRERWVRYTKMLTALYRALRDVSGCTYIVDSSKDPSYGFL